VSEQNVERDRRAIEAFNARDMASFLALCDPEIEVHSVFAAVGGAVYRGHDGVRSWIRDLQEAWGDELHIEAESFFDLGEHTLAFQVLHGRGLQSGVDVAMPNAHIVRWREGLIVYLKVTSTERMPSATWASLMKPSCQVLMTGRQALWLTAADPDALIESARSLGLRRVPAPPRA
jgi:ketosteroid isomerase-like protein